MKTTSSALLLRLSLALLVFAAAAASLRGQTTNCCAGCVAPYPYSYTVTVYPGTNYLANDLCQGTNDTVGDLITNVPAKTALAVWNPATDSFDTDVYTKSGWSNPGLTLSPGSGFILISPATTTYTLTIFGCLPTCPPPCLPSTNGFQIVGGVGTNTATWSNLSSCPPICGTEVITFDPKTQQWSTNIYVNGIWAPSAPVLGVGQSALVGLGSDFGLTVVCPSNMVFTCGSGWSFTAPTAASCCPSNFVSSTGVLTNVLVTPVSTTTSGVCPQVITMTWVITDACGESNTCSQTVTLVDEPEILSCATNLTLCKSNNCAVLPDFTSQVQAADPCGAPFTIEQSPLPGTLICTNTVLTFTVSNACGNSAFCTALVSLTQCGSPCLPTSLALFNTGVDTNGAPLPAGSVDPHYVLSANPDGGGSDVYVVSNPIWSPPNDAISQWVGPDASGGYDPDGTYVYETTFEVPCTNNLIITGQWAADNTGCIYVDSPANSPISCIGSTNSTDQSGFDQWHPFTITSGLTPGVHTLLFVVTNNPGGDSPTGLRVEISGSVNCCCCGPNRGPQAIQWLQLPLSTTEPPATVLQATACGNWLVTNLPCYGRVLVVETFPGNVSDFSNAGFQNVPNAEGDFLNVEPGYGPYDWGTAPDLNFLNTITSGNDNLYYSVNFYFLDGPPNPCTLFVSASGLAQFTIATVSQPVVFRGEWDLTNTSPESAHTSITNSAYNPYTNAAGSTNAGTVGTVIGSYYNTDTYGDEKNTGWPLFQPTGPLLTTNLPQGAYTNCSGYPAAATVPYISLNVSQQPGDGIGFNIGYVCCTNGCTNCGNCLQVVCPNDKTAACGSAWSFDEPTATSCCASNFVSTNGVLTNVMIASLGAVTNLGCPLVITKTWRITDPCGNSSTCSQVVTLTNASPPSIICPTGIVLVANTKNCEFMIPSISITATDACTPSCQLVITQSPPAGTILPMCDSNRVEVTVKVTDLCGLSDQCRVVVEGEFTYPPVITCPSSMAVTNCVVPCVPVSATACCCPANELSITQSPPCGTPLGPGMDSVKVMVTDCHGNTSQKKVALIIGNLQQSFLADLFNTGATNDSASSPIILLNDNAVDGAWAQASPPMTAPAGMPSDYHNYPVAVSPACNPVNHCYVYSGGCPAQERYVPWDLFNSSASKWMAPNFPYNACDPPNDYTYSLKFNLPSDIAPGTATISGRFAVDDTVASLQLNGHTLAFPSGTWKSWTPFVIAPNPYFVTGPNTLTFTVYNQQQWTGLRVEFTQAYGNCATCAPPVIKSITQAQSLPQGSSILLGVVAGGTPPYTYQWYYNSQPVAGATSSTLRFLATYANAGIYSVVVANPCGVVTGTIPVKVTSLVQWPIGSWTAQEATNGLSATIGSDLVLAGSSDATNFTLSTGTTEDFGLPEEGGQAVNVMHLNPSAPASLQLPLLAPSGSTAVASYTVIMDLYEPDTSLGEPATLFATVGCCISNLSSGGQDGLAFMMDETNNLHVIGSIGGTPFDSVSSVPLPVDTWNRVALVVDSSQYAGSPVISGFLNGSTVVQQVPCDPCCSSPCCYGVMMFTNIIRAGSGTAVNWANASPTVLSAMDDAVSPNAEFYASSIQFQAAALTPQAIAGLGSPDNGPAPVTPTAVSASPAISATAGNGTISLSWSSTSYQLQETTDLTSGLWVDSQVPFTEAPGSTGNVMTTAVVNAGSGAPAKFYRLVFRP